MNVCPFPLLVPTAAVQRNAQATYVFVVKPDQTVTSRPVVMGITEGDESEITSGLAPAEVVVMTGIDKLQEGSKVDAQIAPESGGVKPQPGGQQGSQPSGGAKPQAAGQQGNQPVGQQGSQPSSKKGSQKEN